MSRGRALSVAKPAAGSGLKDAKQRNAAIKAADRAQRRMGKMARKVGDQTFKQMMLNKALERAEWPTCGGQACGQGAASHGRGGAQGVFLLPDVGCTMAKPAPKSLACLPLTTT